MRRLLGRVEYIGEALLTAEDRLCDFPYLGVDPARTGLVVFLVFTGSLLPQGRRQREDNNRVLRRGKEHVSRAIWPRPEILAFCRLKQVDCIEF